MIIAQANHLLLFHRKQKKQNLTGSSSGLSCFLSLPIPNALSVTRTVAKISESIYKDLQLREQLRIPAQGAATGFSFHFLYRQYRKNQPDVKVGKGGFRIKNYDKKNTITNPPGKKLMQKPRKIPGFYIKVI